MSTQNNPNSGADMKLKDKNITAESFFVPGKHKVSEAEKKSTFDPKVGSVPRVTN